LVLGPPRAGQERDEAATRAQFLCVRTAEQ
jgi:hypothetical protein